MPAAAASLTPAAGTSVHLPPGPACELRGHTSCPRSQTQGEPRGPQSACLQEAALRASEPLWHLRGLPWEGSPDEDPRG